MFRATTRQLEVFAAVARHLSFVRAAEELHLTPPAISMQIRQLETLVGLPLFERSRSAVSLTITGEYLLVHARRVLAALKDAEDLIARLRKVEVGRLSIGMLGTAKYFLPSLLTGFLQDHPGVDIRLTEGNRQDLVDSLHRNEVDLAVMGRPPRELDTRAEPFAPHPLAVVAGAGHRLADRAQVTPEMLSGEAFIIREHGSGTRLAMESVFGQWHIDPPVIMQMTSNESIKQAVMANMGLSFLSLHTAEVELASARLRCLPIEDMPLMRHWHIVHVRARTLSPAAEAFRYYVLERGAAFLQTHFTAVTAACKPPGTARKANKTRKSRSDV